jgi:hypothetical protein
MHNIICLAKDATLRPKKDKDVLSLENPVPHLLSSPQALLNIPIATGMAKSR